MNMRRTIPTLLLCIFICVTLQTIMGIVMLYSTTVVTHGEGLLKRQLVWIFLGIIAALAMYRVDYRQIGRRCHWILGIVSLPLVYLATVHVLARVGLSDGALAMFPFVHEVNGAYRWLFIGGQSVQPSEFAKLAIVVFVAAYYGGNPRYLQSFRRGVFRPLLAIGAVILAIFLGGSLSVTAITGCTVMVLLFVAGMRLRYFVLFAAVGAVLLFAAIHHSPARMSRLTSFRNPELVKDSSGYQLWSSQLALGSGHWHGVGFNQSRMKEYYLPEAHTDFIVSIIGEELGFAAVAGILLLYLLLVGASFGVAMAARDRQGMLLAVGVGTLVGLHAFVNIGVVSGFLPTTGVSAPLISYGGSSMLVTWIALGMLLNVGQVALTEPETTEDLTPAHADAVLMPRRHPA
jgi:cell division protein FtsW